jgi:hypothetical protein
LRRLLSYDHDRQRELIAAACRALDWNRATRNAARVITLFTAGLALGCGVEPRGATPSPTVTTASDGASLVENPAEPNPATAGHVVLVDAGRYRLVHPPDTSAITDPIALEYAHGSLWILDAATSRILRWEPASRAITGTLGGPGRGPGEFAQPAEITSTNTGIAVWDIGQSTVRYFSADGAIAGDLHLPGMYPRAVVLEDGQVLAWGLAGESRMPDLFDPAGGKRTVALTGWRERADQVGPGESECFFTDRIGALVALGSCETPRLSVHLTNGRRVAEWSVTREPTRSSQAELRQLRDAFARTMARSGLPDSIATRVAESSASAYAVQRMFQRVVAAPTLALVLLLEQRPAELEPEEARLLVFSGQGVYLANIDLPLAVVDLAASGDTLYILGRERPSESAELYLFRIEGSEMANSRARLRGARTVLDRE